MRWLMTIIRKILSRFATVFYRFSDDELLRDCKWIEKLCSAYRRVILITPRYSVIYFLKPYTEQLSHCITPNNKEQMIAKWRAFFADQNDDVKYFMTVLYYLTDMIDDDVSKDIMQYAKETNNPMYRYWTTMNISNMTFRTQSGIYPSYYIERRELFKKIADESGLTMPVNSKRTKNSVCLITYTLKPSLKHSVQRVVSMFANSLDKRGMKVLVLTLESFSISISEGRSVYTPFYTKSADKQMAAIQSFFSDNVNIVSAGSGSYLERAQRALNLIAAFGPSCIIDISDEYSFLSNIYQKEYPVYYIPMRGASSSSCFTYILGEKWTYEADNIKYHSIDMNKVQTWMFPEYVPECNKVLTRKECGFHDNDFIIISIGNNNAGFSSSAVDQICSMLLKNENMIWLLVGNPAPIYLHQKYQELINKHRIIEWGFEENLPALCRICNVHLRSDITGGSGATAIAAMQGLPIVMKSKLCDPMRWLGNDFTMIKDDVAIIEEIEHLCFDNDYYVTQSNKAKEKVEIASNADFWWDQLQSIITSSMKGEKQ